MSSANQDAIVVPVVISGVEILKNHLPEQMRELLESRLQEARATLELKLELAGAKIAPRAEAA